MGYMIRGLGSGLQLSEIYVVGFQISSGLGCSWVEAIPTTGTDRLDPSKHNIASLLTVLEQSQKIQ